MKTISLNPDEFHAQALQPALDALANGGVIAYPTETIYGLGADMYSAIAVQKIFRIKRRDAGKPLSVMVNSVQMAEDLCRDIPAYARVLMAQYWPGPLTLVLKASSKVPKEIASADSKIGLRLPDHLISRELVRGFGRPLTSTSANLSGQAAAKSAQDVVAALGQELDLIIDAGECKLQVASTVVDATGHRARVLRTGTITEAEIDEIAGGVTV